MTKTTDKIRTKSILLDQAEYYEANNMKHNINVEKTKQEIQDLVFELLLNGEGEEKIEGDSLGYKGGF